MDLLDSFPAGATPRAEQKRLLTVLADALSEIEDGSAAPRVLVVEAPPGVGKSHVALTLARWSGDAYLLTSQKLLQDQYEAEFGADLAVVKGRDNYPCERYPAWVPTSRGLCRRSRGPVCGCPYVRAKQAAMNAPIFCTNTAYFATLRHWHAEQLRRRRLLIVDEAHNLESQLVGVFTARWSHDEMRAWFGAPLPRLPAADDYRPLLAGHVERLDATLAEVRRQLEALRPPALAPEVFLEMPPSREEIELLEQRDALESTLARLAWFLDADDREWIVRYPEQPGAELALVPLTVASLARELFDACAEVTVLSSAYLGHRTVLAEAFGLDEDGVRACSTGSPFALEQRPIVYRPVGALSQATRARLEPALFAEVAAILAAHPEDKGLIHVASYAAGRRLVHDLSVRAPRQARRLLWIDAADGKAAALQLHRSSSRASVLVSPSLREGIDLPDHLLRFQVLTKLPYPDLGDPWTAARHARDPRWYAVETAKALIQTYGRACRHARDHGVTYVLDERLERFVQRYRVLLPEWFLDAAEPALRAARPGGC
jgi:Rad3-related DNA helicase